MESYVRSCRVLSGLYGCTIDGVRDDLDGPGECLLGVERAALRRVLTPCRLRVSHGDGVAHLLLHLCCMAWSFPRFVDYGGCPFPLVMFVMPSDLCHVEDDLLKSFRRCHAGSCRLCGAMTRRAVKLLISKRSSEARELAGQLI